MKRQQNKHFLAVLSLCLLTTACSKPASPRVTAPIKVDGNHALKLVGEIVAFGPRPSGSRNAKRTAEFLAAKCGEFGCPAIIDEWQEQTPNGMLTFRNVCAELKGDTRTIILGSHYDTKDIPRFLGANDAGSSTGLVLEIMRVIKAQPNWDGPTILFAFFDGEECIKSYGKHDGLHGSKRYAKALQADGRAPSINAMILLDMIGDKDLSLTLSRDDDTKLKDLLRKIAGEQGVADKVREFGGGILDDHVPFKQIGIPAIDLIDFDFGPNNNHWHTTEDSMDKLSAESLQIVGDLTLQLIQEIE